MFTVIEEYDGYTMTGWGKIDQPLIFNRFERKNLIFIKQNGKEYSVYIDTFLSGFIHPTMDGLRFYLTLNNKMSKDDVVNLVIDYLKN